MGAELEHHPLPKPLSCWGSGWVLGLGLILRPRPHPTLVGEGLGAALGLIPLPRPHGALEQLLGLWSSSFETPSSPGLGKAGCWSCTITPSLAHPTLGWVLGALRFSSDLGGKTLR